MVILMGLSAKAPWVPLAKRWSCDLHWTSASLRTLAPEGREAETWSWPPRQQSPRERPSSSFCFLDPLRCPGFLTSPDSEPCPLFSISFRSSLNYLHSKDFIWFREIQFSSVQCSCSVMSDSLRPHELQHARLPCPSPTPGVHSDSCPSRQWYHPAISSSVVPFSSCPQSLPASESFV